MACILGTPSLSLWCFQVWSTNGLLFCDLTQDFVNVLTSVSDWTSARRAPDLAPIGRQRHLDFIVLLTRRRCGNASKHSCSSAVFVLEMNVRNFATWIVLVTSVSYNSKSLQWNARHGGGFSFWCDRLYFAFFVSPRCHDLISDDNL